ncbi:MAG: FAD-dependent monooxygenase [Proteobacteria bacterium]|nr:FAD-dependent monooxygenase [Pseudomonadota bacterium]
MSLLVKQLSVPVGPVAADLQLRALLAQELAIPESEILGLSILKKSLDARKKSRIVYHYQLRVDCLDETAVLGSTASSNVETYVERPAFHPMEGLSLEGKRFRHPPIIIGSGPAGSFAAQVLSEMGQPCIVIERGEAVEARMRTVHRLLRSSEFSEESNYCYGEGGAGTFSDGKLTCGRNHPLIRYLFEQWVRFGAPEDILHDAHPHIGTDYLMQIAKRSRQHLESLGSQFLFNKRFVDFKTHSNLGARYTVQFSDGTEMATDHLILAIGHSARETYQMLYDRGLALGPKPFAIGARFEHPQELIDKIQFGSCTVLPAAEYKLAAQAGNRGIWTFCMCPGGHLMPTNAQAEHLAINGMSYNARNSGFANAAVVVNVTREDYFKGHPLDGMHFQAAIERAAFQAGGSQYFTPAQRLTDFLKGRESRGELKSSYKPGVTSYRLDRLLPDFVVSSLQGALTEYNKRMQGFVSDEAIVAGVETKTSAPILMFRDKGLQSTSHPGIFPTGEGAGYAGGIVSAALDGVKIGRAVVENALAEQLLVTVH